MRLSAQKVELCSGVPILDMQVTQSVSDICTSNRGGCRSRSHKHVIVPEKRLSTSPTARTPKPEPQCLKATGTKLGPRPLTIVVSILFSFIPI